jgi:hypothetical protein
MAASLLCSETSSLVDGVDDVDDDDNNDDDDIMWAGMNVVANSTTRTRWMTCSASAKRKQARRMWDKAGQEQQYDSCSSS